MTSAASPLVVASIYSMQPLRRLNFKDSCQISGPIPLPASKGMEAMNAFLRTHMTHAKSENIFLSYLEDTSDEDYGETQFS